MFLSNLKANWFEIKVENSNWGYIDTQSNTETCSPAVQYAI